MIATGNDHQCGHPLVRDCGCGEHATEPRCAVCDASPWWYWHRWYSERFKEPA